MTSAAATGNGEPVTIIDRSVICVSFLIVHAAAVRDCVQSDLHHLII